MSSDPVTVFGDSAYADGATLDKLAEAGHTVFAKVPPVRNSKGYSKDEFTLRAACTTSRSGRVITIHPHEARLQHAKAAQRDPDWQRTYRATRPTVERKIAHFARRAWGGRRTRCQGQARILTRDHPRRSGQRRQPRPPRPALHPGRLGHRLTRPLGPPRQPARADSRTATPGPPHHTAAITADTTGRPPNLRTPTASPNKALNQRPPRI